MNENVLASDQLDNLHTVVPVADHYDVAALVNPAVEICGEVFERPLKSFSVWHYSVLAMAGWPDPSDVSHVAWVTDVNFHCRLKTMSADGSSALNARIGAQHPYTELTAHYSFIPEGLMSSGTVIQQNTSGVIRVRWGKKVDGITTWASSDPTLLEVESDQDETTRATVTASETGLGYVEVYATAPRGDGKVTAIFPLSVIEGETEQGNIEFE